MHALPALLCRDCERRCVRVSARVHSNGRGVPAAAQFLTDLCGHKRRVHSHTPAVRTSRSAACGCVERRNCGCTRVACVSRVHRRSYGRCLFLGVRGRMGARELNGTILVRDRLRCADVDAADAPCRDELGARPGARSALHARCNVAASVSHVATADNTAYRWPSPLYFRRCASDVGCTPARDKVNVSLQRRAVAFIPSDGCDIHGRHDIGSP